LSDDAQAVVVEVSEAVGAALDELHLSMEAFGDAVVLREAPHARDLLRPVREGACEGGERSEAAVGEAACHPYESVGESAALPGGSVAHGEQLAEASHLRVDGFEGGMAFEEFVQAASLGLGEPVGALAQGGEVSAVASEFGGDAPEEFHEVVEGQADDVEAVGDDACVGEVSADKGPVGGAHVDADHANPFPASESGEKGFERGSGLALDDVEDAVVAQIAEGGGEAAALVEGVLVDAENLRALERDSLACPAHGELVVDAFDGGGAHAGDPCHARAADALVMIAVDASSERFGGVAPRPDAGQRLDEAGAALKAQEAAALDDQSCVAPEALEMPGPPPIPALAVEAAASTARAALRPRLDGFDDQFHC